MIDDIEVPKRLMGSFKRVVRRIPVDLKKDEELIRTVLAYLELGGEKLARQAVEAAKQTLELEIAQRRKKSREEALIRAAEARQAAAEEDAEGDDADDDDDDADDDDDDDVKAY
jgi:phosphopantothenoylcysteine synthetase/decarboxylase